MLLFRRFLLIFTPSPLLVLIPQWTWTHSVYYVTTSVILSTGSLLINFPKIIHWIHGKSVRFEDLEDENAITPKMKKRFQKAFEIVITIMLAILMAVLIDYYLDRFNNTELSNIEVLGVVGGFMSLLHRIQNIIGKFLLIFLHCYKTEISPKLSASNLRDLKTPDVPDLELGSPQYPFNQEVEMV